MGKKKKTGPRPKLRDAATRAKLLAFVRKGSGLHVACAKLGCSYQTLQNERQRDPEFAAAVEQALAERIGVVEDLVFAHAVADPPTARWLLACLDRENYAPKPEQQTHVHAHAHVIADPDAIKSQLAALATELGIENVVEPVRIEKANGHHKANGSSGNADATGPEHS